MKKRLLALALAVVLIFSAFPMQALMVSAAAEGTMISNAVEVELGQTYFKAWTSSTDHLNHYVKFVVPAQGVVTITATKPFDSEGEYGRMSFTVYNSGNIAIWDNSGYYACDDISYRYTMRLGLAPGTYYMTIKPRFYVTSGTIETNYSVSFAANTACEIEPNDTGRYATPLSLGQAYIGWYGSDGGDHEENDYFKFNVTQGHTYRITWYDYENMVDTTSIIKYIDPSNEDETISDSQFDSNGYSYEEVTAQQSGTAYIRIYNYHKNQIKYTFSVVDMTCQTSGHHYRSTVTMPTEYTNGYTTFTCTSCGDRRIENYIFPDVRNTSWYYDAVEFAARKGYFSGYQSGKFGPADNISRQDFVLVLARIDGVDLTAYAAGTGFKDVVAGSYYEAAVNWAVTEGISTGYNPTEFGVGDKITREQLVTMLYRYAIKKGYDVSVTEGAEEKLNAFGDAGRVSPFAKDACVWAIDKGVIKGLTATTVGPQGNASRAQAAQILKNISDNNVLPF